MSLLACFTLLFSSNTIHRVSGVTGIHAAHLAAAKLSTTPMFWVVDGDAVIEDDFKFDHLHFELSLLHFNPDHPHFQKDHHYTNPTNLVHLS